MSEHRTPEPGAPWTELVATDADWDAADPELLYGHARPAAVLIRAFEEYVLELAAAGPGARPGPLQHRPGGRRGRLGARAHRATDKVNGSHRGHHQFLAKALATWQPKAVSTAPKPVRRRDVRDGRAARTLAEICGLGRRLRQRPRRLDAPAVARGRRDGHQRHRRRRRAAGRRLRLGDQRHAGTDAVSVTYFGDGAANIGSVLETFNLAAAWKLPVCFFIENNQYAVSTHVGEATARAPAVGARPRLRHPELAGRRHGPARRAPRHDARPSSTCARGNGPTIVEADLYRYFHQNGPFPGSAFGYRSKEEEASLAGPRPDRRRSRPRSSGAACSRRGRDRASRRASRPGCMARARRRAARAGPGRQARASSASGRPVAGPGLRGRRRPRRPVRAATGARYEEDDLRRRAGRDARSSTSSPT